MKITSDYEGRDDGYDDDVIRYYEELQDGEDYFYEVYVLIDGKKSRIIITDAGVSVDFWEGGTIHTNIVPERMFPGLKRLAWKNIACIIKVLEATGIEGKNYSEEEMFDIYVKWRARDLADETGED